VLSVLFAFSRPGNLPARLFSRLACDPPNTLSKRSCLKAVEAPYNAVAVRCIFESLGRFQPTVSIRWTILEFLIYRNNAASPSVLCLRAIDRWGTWWGQLVPLASLRAPCVFILAQASQSREHGRPWH